MNKILSVLIGLILLVIPIYAWVMNSYGLGNAAMLFLKGGIMWGVILIGLVLILLGLNSLSD